MCKDPEFQMMGVSGSCWSWNLCNASLVQLIFSVCLNLFFMVVFYIFDYFIFAVYGTTSRSLISNSKPKYLGERRKKLLVPRFRIVFGKCE